MKIAQSLVVLFVLALGLATAACGSSPTSASAVSAVAVTGAVPGVGSSSQFVATALTAAGTTQDVTASATWTSSNTNVAVVSSSGLVTAVASGTAIISANYSGIAGTDAISVP